MLQEVVVFETSAVASMSCSPLNSSSFKVLKADAGWTAEPKPLVVPYTFLADMVL